MLAADIADNHFVKIVARNFQGGGHGNAVHAQHGDVRSAAADVHHHVAAGTPDIQAGAQTGSQRLLDEEHPAGTGFDGSVDDAALFHLGYAGGDGDDHTGLGGEQAGLGGGLEHLLKHPDGHLMVGDNAVLQRVHGNHVAGGSAQHIPGGGAYLQNLAGIPVYRHNGGLSNDDTLAVGINQHIGRAQIHAQIIGKHRKQRHSYTFTFVPPPQRRNVLPSPRHQDTPWRIPRR